MDAKENPDLFSEYLPAFDKAAYHAKAENFPKEAGYYQAYVHIGFFLGFLAEQRLLDDNILSRKKVQQFLKRDLHPGELAKCLGGKIDPVDMNDEGRKFAYFYYPGQDKDGDVVGLSRTIYLLEYIQVLNSEVEAAGDPYLISDNWENYEKVRDRIRNRYENWISEGRPRPHYRNFHSFNSANAEKIKVYLSNKLASGFISKSYPVVTVEEPRFNSYMIKIDSDGHESLSKQFYSVEKEIRDYLKSFTDRHIYFNLK